MQLNRESTHLHVPEEAVNTDSTKISTAAPHVGIVICDNVGCCNEFHNTCIMIMFVLFVYLCHSYILLIFMKSFFIALL